MVVWMKGKNERSEHKNEKTNETDQTRLENSQNQEKEGEDTAHGEITRLQSLKTLLSSINAPFNEWPGEVLKATLKRFGRMLRRG